MEQEKVFFFDDSPREDLSSNDAFGHAFYARALYQIIENTFTKSAHAIGLFGKWGVGKTSIINEFRRIVAEEATAESSSQRYSYEIIPLDTWKYSNSNFRREFLLDLGKHFGCEEYVQSRLTTKRTIEAKEAPEFNRRWFGQLGLQVALALAIFGISYFAIDWVTSQTALDSQISNFIALIVSAFLPALTVFRDNIKDLFTFQTTIKETQPVVHPDEFEEIFQHIIREEASLSDENDRLVIVLDNLDRVEEDVVVQILGAVKTFLREDRCIYVLPCDEQGLKHHIISMRSGSNEIDRMTLSQAGEYLRKFFQTTLTIRDLLSEDLDKFVDDVLRKMRIFDTQSEQPERGSELEKKATERDEKNRNEVGLVLRIAINRNPRRIIQLANKLSANSLLAMERGSADPLLEDVISENLGFLAKVTVIEEEWPEFYELVTRHPDVLRKMRTFFVTESDEAMPNMLNRHLTQSSLEFDADIEREWTSGLKDFLRRTYTIHADDVASFLLFRQATSIPEISDYFTFYDASLSRDTESVINILSDDQTNIDIAFNHLIRELRRRVELRDKPAALSLVLCICTAFHLIPTEQSSLARSVADAVAETMGKHMFADSVLDVGFSELLKALRYSTRKASVERIIDYSLSLADFVNEQETTQFMLSELVQNGDLLSPSNRLRINRLIGGIAEEESLVAAVRGFANDCLNANQKLAKDLIPQSVYAFNVNLLRRPGSEADEALEFLVDFLSLLSPKTALLYKEAALSHLQSPGEAITPQVEFGLKLLEAVPSDFIPETERISTIQALASVANATGGANSRVLVTYLHLLPSLGVEEQVQFRRNLHASIAAADAATMSIALDVSSQHQAQISDLEDLLVVIRDRILALGGAPDLRNAFFELARKSDKTEQISRYVMASFSQPTQGIEVLKEAKAYLAAQGFRDLIDEVIDHAANLPESQMEEVLTAVGTHSDKYTKAYLKSLTEKLINDWYRKPSVHERNAAKALWQGVRDSATDERDRFHERLLEYVRGSINDMTIANPPNKVYIDTMVDERSFLSESRAEDLIDLLLRMTEEGSHPPIKSLGYESLGKLSDMEYAEGRVPNELISDLSNEDDPGVLHSILNTLLVYKSLLTRKQRQNLELVLEQREEQPPFAEFKDQLID